MLLQNTMSVGDTLELMNKLLESGIINKDDKLGIINSNKEVCVVAGFTAPKIMLNPEYAHDICTVVIIDNP